MHTLATPLVCRKIDSSSIFFCFVSEDEQKNTESRLVELLRQEDEPIPFVPADPQAGKNEEILSIKTNNNPGGMVTAFEAPRK